jgi:hypothetical protein
MLDSTAEPMVNHANGKCLNFPASKLPRHLIWVKETFVMKPNNYHYQYEMIFYGFKESGGGLNKWFGGRTESEASDVWQVKRDSSAEYMHPTQKPVDLPTERLKTVAHRLASFMSLSAVAAQPSSLARTWAASATPSRLVTRTIAPSSLSAWRPRSLTSR